ncbi:MAG TPA: undecaprenyl diphosphate synthase family protein [Planctomycetota bacterium]|nr:undecaprenyl diphosphate synthase family protein [Planctomycetota bacterium]
MITTLVQSAPQESVLKAPARATTGAAPRHLAIALGAGAGTQSPSLHTAAAALHAVAEGCAERGVAALTLLRPAGETEIFEAALASFPPMGVALNLASERDGRAELLSAVRELALRAQRGELSAGAIDARMIESKLSTRGLPAVDLLIATGGGEKLCGALLWQCAYAELLFLDVPWFDFTRAHFDAALADYARRCRKFGGLSAL